MNPQIVKLPNFKVGPYEIISQDPSAVSNDDQIVSATQFLPAFLRYWAALERVTGYRWKCTSYLRQSPSHSRGHSFDLAPDIALGAQKHYAVYNGSDPVLYKRGILLRKLQSMKNLRFIEDPYFLGVFVEPDHLHVQVLMKEPGQVESTKLYKYKQLKAVYSDTASRIKLPMLN